MKTIYKYPLYIMDEQTVLLPDNAQPLSVQIQNGELYMWALVDSQSASNPRRVRIFGTGNHVVLDGNWQFVATVQERMFVWHVFVEMV